VGGREGKLRGEREERLTRRLSPMWIEQPDCRTERVRTNWQYNATQLNGCCSSSRKVSHEWPATLWENNRRNNRNNASSPKTITAANNEENYKLTRAAILLNKIQSKRKMKQNKTIPNSTNFVNTPMLMLSWCFGAHINLQKRSTKKYNKNTVEPR